MFKTVIFEEENPIEIEIELEINYSYTPGRTCGPPELCYPNEETIDITLEAGWKDKVKAKYLEMAEDMIKHIENHEFDPDDIRNWVNDEAQANEDAKAEDAFERSREYEAY